MVLEVSAIDFTTSNSRVSQIIGRFGNAQDAENAFNQHYFSGSTEGKYAMTYKPISNLKYKSPIADRFYVTCGTLNSTQDILITQYCVIYAQYQEFLSIIIYNVYNTKKGDLDDNIIMNIEMLTKITDKKFSYYLTR